MMHDSDTTVSNIVQHKQERCFPLPGTPPSLYSITLQKPENTETQPKTGLSSSFKEKVLLDLDDFTSIVSPANSTLTNPISSIPKRIKFDKKTHLLNDINLDDDDDDDDAFVLVPPISLSSSKKKMLPLSTSIENSNTSKQGQYNTEMYSNNNLFVPIGEESLESSESSEYRSSCTISRHEKAAQIGSDEYTRISNKRSNNPREVQVPRIHLKARKSFVSKNGFDSIFLL